MSVEKYMRVNTVQFHFYDVTEQGELIMKKIRTVLGAIDGGID